MSTAPPPRWLARGLNLAGIFDRRDDTAPEWPERDSELAAVRAAGFTHVRLPVRWWGHAERHAPFALDPRFAEEVDGAVAAAHSHGLGVVLSMHHADGVMAGERGAFDRLCGLWHQVARRHRGSVDLAYDVLNEPRDVVTAPAWNRLLPTVVSAVRDIDPDRTVIVAGALMSTVDGLLALEPPTDDHLLVTLHYYEPFRFTHQAVQWEPASAAWAGTRWGTRSDHQAVTQDLEAAHRWATSRGLSLYVGEFGTHRNATSSDRVAWTAWVRTELTRLGVPWACWDFRTDFGVYDAPHRRWRGRLLSALVEVDRSRPPERQG